MKKCVLLIFFSGVYLTVTAQHYYAVHGSSYEASLNVSSNPASIVNAPFTWDLTVFGTQLESISNAFTIHDYSLLSSPRNSMYSINNGDYARHGLVGFNTNLLNTRIALNRRKALAFGINLRGYGDLRTDSYNYMDTIRDINNFIGINALTPALNGEFTHSSWLEIFGTYSQTLWDSETGRLNAGVTLKVNRGLSGAIARVRDVAVDKQILPDGYNYELQSGRLDYGYSSNYDRWQNSRTTNQNLTDFVKFTEGGLSLDIGVEYLVKTQAVTTFSDADDGYYEYEWKFGLALLDIGQANYKYGKNSRLIADPKANINSGMLEDKFYFINSIEDFNDSLATIARTVAARRGPFSIIHPARLVLNADRYLWDDFYINGELSLNLSSLAGDKKNAVRGLSLLAITPRWETRRWGVYLPLRYNNGGDFRVGAAFKAGPLLLGLHNVANLFSKTSVQNGGGYIALIIRPWKTNRYGRYDELDCP